MRLSELSDSEIEILIDNIHRPDALKAYLDIFQMLHKTNDKPAGVIGRKEILERLERAGLEFDAQESFAD